MQLISKKYRHEETGIEFEIQYVYPLVLDRESTRLDIQKKIRVDSKSGKGTFMFNMSSPETLIKIGNALRAIGEFCKNL